VKKAVYPIITFTIIITVWHIYVAAFHIPATVLPTPFAVMRALAVHWKSAILPELIFSLSIILSGYVISVSAGFILAAVCAQSKITARAVMPVAAMFLVTPMVVLIPILMVSFGFSPLIRVAVVAFQSTPIILLNTLTGFTRAEAVGHDLMAAYGCSRWRSFFKFTVYQAMPQIFAGLKLGCIISVISALSADFAMGKVGLGYRIKMSSALAAVDLVFATVLVSALVGIAMFEIVSLFERKFVVWRQS